MSVTATVPERVPVAVGLKVTEMVQLAPAATLEPQLFVCAKSPVMEMPVMLKAALPLLVRVTVCAALVVFSTWLAKVKEAGASVTAGAGAVTPLPLSVT